MPAQINMAVRVNGGLFSRNIPESVRRAVRQEALDKLGARLTREGIYGSGGKGLGVRLNKVRRLPDGELDITVASTRNWPRTKGTSWLVKNVVIVRSMAPRVLRKAADRIVSEMSGV